MGSDNQNEDAKSKIEKIRIDLEKKLAALEAVKLKSAKKANLIVEKGEDVVEESEEIAINKEVDTNRSFIEQISDIENSSNFDNFKIEETIEETIEEIKDVDKENEVLPIDVSNVKEFKEEITTVEDNELIETSEETFFEITDEIENIEEEILIKESVKITPTIEKEKEPVKNEKLITPIVVTNIDEKLSVKNNDSTKEKNKSSSLNYLIYALATIVILGIGYLGWNYLNKSSKNNDKMLSEFENQKYKDSIELADAKNQLSDFISQRYIDSIANANQIVLDNTNSSKKPIRTSSNKPKSRSTVLVNTSIQPSSNNVIEQTINNDGINDGINDNVVSNSNNSINDNFLEKSDVTVDNTETPKPKKTETLSTIEKSPIYPGCEKKGSELAKKKCLMSKVSKFVQNKFNGDLSQDLGLDSGRKRINVQFIIDKNGTATVLRVRGQHKVLEKEALRVVNSLPKMKPGRKDGKTEPVIYNLPIVYNVEY